MYHKIKVNKKAAKFAAFLFTLILTMLSSPPAYNSTPQV